jgi:hypothetical protein
MVRKYKIETVNIRMYSSIYETFYNRVRGERFSGSGPGSSHESGQNEFIVSVMASVGVILLVILQLFIVKTLWNVVLVRLFSGVKPIPSLLYALGLLILVAAVLPGPCPGFAL